MARVAPHSELTGISLLRSHSSSITMDYGAPGGRGCYNCKSTSSSDFIIGLASRGNVAGVQGRTGFPDCHKIYLSYPHLTDPCMAL